MNLRMLLLLWGVAFGAWSGIAKADQVVTGEPVSIGNGSARAMLRLGEKGTIQSVGVILSEGALQKLPTAEMTYDYELDLPIRLAPYDHITLNWEPQGHPPLGIYSVPHFDFHFYTLSRADRHAMTCEGLSAPLCTQMPRSEFIPHHYVAGDPVPMMGWHWADSTSPEFNGQSFTRTFLYGYYAGQQAFFEPMITLDHLLSHPNVRQAIKLPEEYSQPGYYPATYRVTYEPATRSTVVSLDDLFYFSR